MEGFEARPVPALKKKKGEVVLVIGGLSGMGDKVLFSPFSLHLLQPTEKF